MQWMAKHYIFENGTLVVIAFNAFWIAIDTDWNGADTLLESPPGFQIMEHAFCFYFSFEWVVRFMAFARKLDCFRDGWFKFDSMLVFLMVTETWVFTIIELNTEVPFPTSILRLFRLLRLSRLLRMLKSLPELMILVKGMITAMKSVFYVMFMLVGITYVFAIALTQLSIGYEFREDYFEHVVLAMYTLMVYTTFLDNLAEFCDTVRVADCFICNSREKLQGGLLKQVFLADSGQLVGRMFGKKSCDPSPKHISAQSPKLNHI